MTTPTTRQKRMERGALNWELRKLKREHKIHADKAAKIFIRIEKIKGKIDALQ